MIEYIQAIRKLRAEKKRKAELDRLLATPLNYGILRDLINSATQKARIEITLPDGVKILIKAEEAGSAANDWKARYTAGAVE